MNTNISALIKLAGEADQPGFKTKKEMLDYADSIIERGKLCKRSVDGIDPRMPAILSLLHGQSAADDMAALHYLNSLGDTLIDQGKTSREFVSTTPGDKFPDVRPRVEKQIADMVNQADEKSKYVGEIQDMKAGVGRNIVRGGLGITADALLNDHNGDYGAADTLTSGIGGIGGGLLGSYLAKKTGLKFMGSTLANLGGSALGGWGANKLRRHFS